MRRFLLAVVILGAATAAQAADMPDFLRGSLVPAVAARPNWQGFYVGGQASYGAADMDFTNSGQDLLKKLLNNIDIEQQFNRASTTGEYLIVAGRYERAGLKQDAKTVVDHATRFCKTAADWSMVADAYRRLGYEENARAAERRGREVRR